MKQKITGINEPITMITGGRIMVTESEPLTYKNALVSLCELAKPGLPGESMKAYAIGMKLFEAKDSIELEEDEIKFLKELLASSESFVAVVVGKLTDLLEPKTK